MAFLNWSDEFDVGVAAIDEEHKQLLAIINRFYDGMSTGASEQTLYSIFNELLDRTKAHFEHEEEYFATTQFPLAAEHEKLHENLTSQIATLQQNDIGKNDTARPLGLTYFLKSWLLDHIQNDDKKLGAHLNKLGIW